MKNRRTNTSTSGTPEGAPATNLEESSRSPRLGSSSELHQNLSINRNNGQTTGKGRVTLLARVAREELPPVLSLAEQLPVPRLEEGTLDMAALVDRFGLKMKQLGYAQDTVSHARTVVRLLVQTAAKEMGHPVEHTAQLLDERVLESLVQYLRLAPSGKRRLPLLEYLVEFLHTGDLTGRTAIPECEWVRSMRKPVHSPEHASKCHSEVTMEPGVDHPMAIAFIEQISRWNEKWQKRAKYSFRKFCTWLANDCGQFANSAPNEVDLGEVTTDHLRSYKGYLEECNLAPNVVGLRMRELRKWFAFLFTSNYIRRDPAMFLRRLPHRRKKASPRILTAEEVEGFLDKLVIESSVPLVDVPLFGCLSALGLRPSETAMLRVRDVNFSNASLTVRSKWNREKSVPLTGTLLHAIERYLQSRADTAAPDSPLWLNKKGNAMSYETVRKRFHTFKEMIKVSRRVGGPHVFRHGFVTELLKAGYDLEDIQALKGDVNLRGLDPYDQTTEEEAHIAMLRAMVGSQEGNSTVES